MFDCVLPTRIARNGTCMTSEGRLVVKMRNSQETSVRSIQTVIATHVKTTRAYIRHLMKCDETFGIRLTSYHNLHFLLNLMEQVRQAIREDRLGDFREEFFEQYGFNKPNAKTSNT